MTDLWRTIWTVLFFGGLGIFAVLAVVTIIGGGFDLTSLLSTLRRRHMAAQETDCPPDERPVG